MPARVVWLLLAVALMVVLLFPLYTIKVQYPAFITLVKENVDNEARRLALRLSAVLVAEDIGLSRQNLPDVLRRQFDALKQDAHIGKIRLYSPAGEILYSTQPSEIGLRNEQDYFRQIVATGTPQSVEVPKDTKSLEGERAAADVVETYVPLTRDGHLIGMLELYYDITAENTKLRHLITRSATALFAMMIVLAGLVVVSAVRAHRSLQQQRRVEAEREALIGQLQEALANVKTLTGLLPICAWCKKVRDDKGYYTSLERYLETHLDAKVTHGVCQECETKLRDQLARGPGKSGPTTSTTGTPPVR